MFAPSLNLNERIVDFKHGIVNTDIITGYTTNPFETVFERAELVYLDENYGTIDFIIPKFNRTTSYISANITILNDLPADVVADAMVYAFYSNQYRQTAAQYTNMNLCHLMDLTRDRVGPLLTQNVYVPRKCPIKKVKLTNIKSGF
ncbi:hypothetical protein CBL_10190 [Carabus blaptoides fortunei]